MEKLLQYLFGEKVEVTFSNIERGTQRHIYQCPIAKALEQKLGRDTEIVISKRVAYISGKASNLPISARRFIRKFDKDRCSVKPFTFRLKL